MELILRKGQHGLTQDVLIYEKAYNIKRDGNYIGVATYKNDPMHGDGFFIEEKCGVLVVCVADGQRGD